MTKCTIIVCFVMTLLRLNSAQADAVWTMNAASCRATPENINSKEYEVSLGAVRHATGSTSRVTLWCPVIATPDYNPPISSVQTLRLASSRVGTDDSAIATVAFIKKNMHSGEEKTLVHFTNASVSTYEVKCGSLYENIQYEDESTVPPQNFTYYVRVDMVRSSTATQDTVFWVELNTTASDTLCKYPR